MPEEWAFNDGMLPEWAPVAAIYQGFAEKQNGMFDRSAFHWATKITRDRGLARGFDRCLPQDMFLIGESNATTGYAACSYSKSDTMLIDDWVTLNEPATRSLINMLSLQRANWQFIEWYGAPVDRLAMLLANHGLPYQRWWVTEQTYLMTRMLDIPAALTARGYGDASGEVILDVTDNLLTENSGRYCLTVHHGKASVTSGQSAKASVIKMNVKGLSALYSGILSPQDLLASGHVEADEAGIAALERLFSCAKPWNTDQC
jgi:predicted acetyltransferase